MTFEEILPILMDNKFIKRKCRTGRIGFIIYNGKRHLRLFSSATFNYAYKITGDDLLAKDWELYNGQY